MVCSHSEEFCVDQEGLCTDTSLLLRIPSCDERYVAM